MWRMQKGRAGTARYAIFGLAMAGVASIPSAARAQLKLLYVDGGYIGTAYASPYDIAWTSALNSAFGASNITVTTRADDFSALGTFDRLVISMTLAPQPGVPLTAAQQAAVHDFAASGRRALLIGEHALWSTWDQSLLTPLGGVAYVGQPCPYNPIPWTTGSTPLIVSQLTEGITAVNPPCAGGVTGGVQVFSDPFASLFGPANNALYFADANIWQDAYQYLGDNALFVQNTATWLATVTTPEPRSEVLVAAGMLLLGTRAVVRRRGAARRA